MFTGRVILRIRLLCSDRQGEENTSFRAGQRSRSRGFWNRRFFRRTVFGRTGTLFCDSVCDNKIRDYANTEGKNCRSLYKEPAFAELFIAHLLARNGRIEADLVDLLFNSSEKRLARTLLLLANFGKEGAPEPILAKISQQTLAEMIGTTRSRVSAFMNKFRQLGLIDYNGNIEVNRSLLNLVLNEKPGISS